MFRARGSVARACLTRLCTVHIAHGRRQAGSRVQGRLQWAGRPGNEAAWGATLGDKGSALLSQGGEGLESSCALGALEEESWKWAHTTFNIHGGQ